MVDIRPIGRFSCKDFADDQSKINMHQISKAMWPDTEA